MIDWNTMAPMRHDLGDLDRDLIEEEVKQAVMQTPNEKVPGVDGSIDAFYKTCWNTITTDVMAALQEMSQLQVG
jgi:predicted nuclease with TOPRIM domain